MSRLRISPAEPWCCGHRSSQLVKCLAVRHDVRADLAEDHQRRVLVDALQYRQIHPDIR
jgi:hypothetical protein